MRDTIDLSSSRALFFAPDNDAFDILTRRQRKKSNKWAGNITTTRMRGREKLAVSVMKVREAPGGVQSCRRARPEARACVQVPRGGARPARHGRRGGSATAGAAAAEPPRAPTAARARPDPPRPARGPPT
jgi:hypothetical protein